MRSEAEYLSSVAFRAGEFIVLVRRVVLVAINVGLRFASVCFAAHYSGSRMFGNFSSMLESGTTYIVARNSRSSRTVRPVVYSWLTL
jgi:hypothetical protein